MSLDYFEQEVETVRAEAERERDVYNRRASEIDRDPTLSDEGKTQARAAAQDAIAPRLKSLRAREDEIINRKINELELRIDSKSGNTSSDIIAFRDAQDRAERIDNPDDAQRILERAMRGGDTSLAHAVFRQAVNKNWGAVTRTFTQANPDLATTVTDLSRLYRFREDTFARNVQYSTFG
jgi:hypothetical protein